MRRKRERQKERERGMEVDCCCHRRGFMYKHTVGFPVQFTKLLATDPPEERRRGVR